MARTQGEKGLHTTWVRGACMAALVGSFLWIGCGTGDVHEGDVELRTEADVERFLADAPHTIRGDLRISAQAAVEHLRFEGLERIEGRLEIRESVGLREVSFPQLRTVASLVVDHNRRLQRLELPELEQVHGALPGGGALLMFENALLEAVRFPKLARVRVLDVAQNARIRRLELPALQEAQRVSLGGHMPEQVAFPALERVDRFLMGHDTKRIRELRLPALREVGSIWVSQLEPLEALDLSRLDVAGALDLALYGPTKIDWPRLAQVDSLTLMSDWSTASAALDHREVQGEDVELSSLKRARTLRFSGHWQRLILPALERVESLELNGPTIADLQADELEEVVELVVLNTGLVRLELPNLVRAVHLEIGAKAPWHPDVDATQIRNAELASLLFPELRTLESLALAAHPTLPACPLETFFPNLDRSELASWAPEPQCECSWREGEIDAICE